MFTAPSFTPYDLPRLLWSALMPSIFSSVVVHLGDSAYSSGEALDITACGRVVGRHFITRKRVGVTCEHCKKTKAYREMGMSDA